MAAGAGGEDSRSLEQTPTWAVSIVCLAFVLVSLLIERSIHLLAHWLKKRHQKSLSEALEKIKAELMLVGFISLLLTVCQKWISQICIPISVGDSFLPCSKEEAAEDTVRDKLIEINDGIKYSWVGHHRKLLFGEHAIFSEEQLRRILAAGDTSGYCEKGKVSLISQDGLHQLHIFIFVLAVFHVLSCITTLFLGRAKMSQWKSWELETQTRDYEFSHDPARFRFTRETTFARRHVNCWAHIPFVTWIVCFFRQFFRSVLKVDYFTLRHGFILAHFAQTSQFDFHKYIKRSVEDDFKVIVTISPLLWFCSAVFLLLNRDGWYTYFWLAFVPLFILVIVGTKLQFIITTMGMQIQDRNPVVHGTPVVKPNDKLFWFNRPRLLLYLVHFTLFQNAFQFAFFFWSWYEYGLRSCFHSRTQDIVSRLSLGIIVQILCSYVTLPLYALVTQMGTNMKTAVFDERVAESLKRWHRGAKKNLRKKSREDGKSHSVIQSGQSTPAHGFSPVHLLRGHRSSGDLQNFETSPAFYNSEYELSDMETPSPSYHARPPQQIYSEAEQKPIESVEDHFDQANATARHFEGESKEEQSDKRNMKRNFSNFSFTKV